MDIGNRIFTKIDRPAKELVEAFRGIPSSNINDMINRLYNMHEYIQLQNPTKFKGSMVGTAFTVKCPAGDNLFCHKALDMIQPGDILVVDADGTSNRSVLGEIMMRMADMMGVAGVVIDGYVRDRDGLNTLEMPIYARGITPQGPWKFGPGEINVPVSVGGQVVFPGDIIVGDEDGIVVIRQKDAPELAKLAQEKKATEEKAIAGMIADIEAYKVKHAGTTAKRMAGMTVPEYDQSYVEMYGL